ncbi:MAG TPA: DEAD/DEAH box helicase, partial [Spirochaetota bacterium]|nr:DEAD/DEAH box helicase [Spirochaetota bacterium]
MLTGDVQYIKGIGPKKAEVLKKEAGIETIEDLLYYMPRRYLDRSDFRAIQDCTVQEIVTVAGTIRRSSIAGARRRFLEVVIDDGTGSLHGVFFGGINYLQKILQPGETVLFSGKVDYYRHLQMVHPDFDFLDEHSKVQSINTGRIVPLYRSSEKLRGSGFDSRGFRRAIRQIIDEHLHEVKDPLEPALLSKYSLQPLREALFALHFPETAAAAETARRRLAFNELFFLQYYLALSRKHIEEESRPRGGVTDAAAVSEFIASLPFSLTHDQLHVIDEISEDLRRPHPMNRLLQGDVGSGKTVVAMVSSLLAAGRGRQTALMAPTEVLSEQHYLNFSTMLPPTVTVTLLTGSMSKKEKTGIYRDIKDGNTDIVIGTHALIQGEVEFRDLGLIIIDEQHRFGVEQRAALRSKGENPDLLVMTATPIPRSLSLTLYGDMDSSYIREKPA